MREFVERIKVDPPPNALNALMSRGQNVFGERPNASALVWVSDIVRKVVSDTTGPATANDRRPFRLRRLPRSTRNMSADWILDGGPPFVPLIYGSPGP